MGLKLYMMHSLSKEYVAFGVKKGWQLNNVRASFWMDNIVPGFDILGGLLKLNKCLMRAKVRSSVMILDASKVGYVIFKANFRSRLCSAQRHILTLLLV